VTAGRDATTLVVGQLGEQLAALERLISAVNEPGNLDGMFAFHILQHTHRPSFTWHVNPLTGPWLDQHADRLRDAPRLAILGYALTHFGRAGNPAKRHLIDGLRELMRREPFPADGVTFVHDPRQLLGITLGSRNAADEVPDVGPWLLDIVNDRRFRAIDTRAKVTRLLTQHMLVGGPAEPFGIAGVDGAAELAWVHWACGRELARLPDPTADLQILQSRILSGLLRTDVAAHPARDAALLYSAGLDIINASIDRAVLSRSHVGVVLRRFPAAMKRWRWDPPDAKHPIRWDVTSEREVQDIVWILLRAVFDDLVEEEPLPRLGHSSYRSDFGLPRLGVLIEVKYARSATDFKKIEKEVIEDSVAYVRDRITYQEIVVFIYDESCSTQEHDITAAALLELDPVTDVVIVSRPSQLVRG